VAVSSKNKLTAVLKKIKKQFLPQKACSVKKQNAFVFENIFL